MRAVDIIAKKRDGQALSQAEIDWFIHEYTADHIPDYQASALLMAIFFKGMSREEIVSLTMAMAQSGQMMDLSALDGYIVDKHSSGGVGDKTSLVVLPLVAACGVSIAKMSGRGLGFSGGTLDKLESIAGMNVNLSDDEFYKLARERRLVLAGQTGELAPADGKLYALRDVTATVDSLPLIASSIMSKKLASGAQGIVLDVKAGHGAFMKTVDEARQLAEMMVVIGTDAGRDVIALLSDMNQPLGQAVGNALEVEEAIATLHNEGPEDLVEHCLEIAAAMLSLAGQGEKWTEETAVRDELREKLQNGQAWEQFRQLVSHQGGDVSMIDDPAQLPQAQHQVDFVAQQTGYVETVTADQVAMAALALGAGRQEKGDPIDPAVGVKVLVQVGDQVTSEQVVAKIYANDWEALETAQKSLEAAITYSDTMIEKPPLFYGKIDGRTDQSS